MSNIKQLGLAFMTYCQDYDETVPLWLHVGAANPYSGGYMTYQVLLEPYMKNTQLWRCPSRAGAGATGAYLMGYYPHYGYACSFCRATRGVAPMFCDPTYGSLGSIQRPAEMPVFAEASANGETNTTYGLYRSGPSSVDPWYNCYPHNEGRNIALADGHAKWYQKRQADNLVWY